MFKQSTMATKMEPSKSRRVLQPLPIFNLTTSSSLPPFSFSSIAINPPSLSIYAGTTSGALLLLSLPHNSDPPPTSEEELNLTRLVSVSQSAIDSVHIAARVSGVLLVSGGFLYVADSELVDGSVKKLGNFKGVTAVARRKSSSDCGSGLSFVFDEVESENWSGSRIIKRLGSGVRGNGVRINSNSENNDDESDGGCVFAVAMAKKVVLIQLSSREVEGQRGAFVILKELPCVEGVKTMAWLDDSIMVGTSLGYSLVSCVTGQVSLIFSFPEVAANPCIKGLSKDKRVLLVVDNAGIIVDRYGQPVGGSLVFRGAPDSVAELSLYVVVVRDGKMELYHKSSGACVQAISLGGSFGGARCCVADEESGSGRFVAVAASSKVFCYRMIPFEEQIRDLVRKKNFKEAISLVEELESEGDISREMLSFVHAQVGFLLLFELKFEEAVDHFLQSETMQPSEIFPFVIRDPNRWSLLVPRNRYWGLHPPPVHIEDVVEDGLLTIQRAIFLKKAGVETDTDNQFLSNPPSRADLLESAFKNFVRYLQIMRDKDLSQSVKEGVDTLLMYLYRSLNCSEDMEKLASSENDCVVKELESLLEESGHMRTLAFLYASKGMSSKALAIWRVLARNYPSDLDQDSVETNSLGRTYSVPFYSKETAAVEASNILEESADQELVLQHLGWISEISEELAIRILTSSKRTSPLPPDDVIAAIDPKKVEILQRYLQWLIEYQDSSDTQFHTLYALSLAKSALEYLETCDLVEQAEKRSLSEDDFNAVNNRLPENPVRERLQIFLHSSDLYDAEDVLELIEDSELWLEKAILYRKLGQEILVLQILALKLEDSEAAEQYCAELGRPDAYMQLLDMYLDPQNGKGPMFKAAVRLLHNHGESLDPLQVLERLSPDMPLKLASETILRMLRARLHHYHQGRIVHSLSRAVDVDARLGRLEERSRSVQINDESLCDSCHARLGTKLFAMYPDDTIVCYKCFRRQGESTSVTGRNFMNDMLIKPGWLVSR